MVPRSQSPDSKPVTFEVAAGFVFHHANAFEQDGKIVIDSICYESFPEVEPGSDFKQVDFDALKPGQLWRFYLNLQDKTVSREVIEEQCCEFPSIHKERMGRPYRYLYTGAAHAATGARGPQPAGLQCPEGLEGQCARLPPAEFRPFAEF